MRKLIGKVVAALTPRKYRWLLEVNDLGEPSPEIEQYAAAIWNETEKMEAEIAVLRQRHKEFMEFMRKREHAP